MSAGATEASYREVLAHPRYLPLFLAAVASSIGDVVARLAVAAVVFHETRSPMATALTLAISVLPSVFGRSLLGPLVDRFAVRQVLVATHLCRAGCVAVLVALVESRAPIGALLAVVFLLEVIGGPAPSANIVLLTRLFPERARYARAMALSALSEQLAQAVGFTAGGVLVALLSARTALVADLVTFVVLALVVAVFAPPGGAFAEPARGLRGLARDLHVAAEYLRRHRVLLPLVLLGVVASVAIAAPEAAAIPYAGGAKAGGVLMGSLMAGATVGLLIIGRWPIERSINRLLPLAVAMPIPLLGTQFHPPVEVVVALWFVSGALQAFMLPLQTSVALLSPAEMRGRVYGFAGALSLTAGGASFLATGWLGELVGPARAVALVAAASLVAVLVLAIRWPAAELSAALGRSGSS